MKQLLAYQDELLSITPSDLVPYDGAGTNWKSAPITFDPDQWNGLVYVQALAMPLESIERNVRQVLAPGLGGVRPAR